MNKTLLETINLKKTFHHKNGIIQLFNNVNIKIKSGDLIALVGDVNASYNEHIKFVSLQVSAGSLEKHEATLSIQIDEDKKMKKSFGNGPVDATFNAIKELTETNFKLKLYQVHAITAGTDAQGEVTVRLESDQ